jgi:hypothetical protein
VLAFVRGIAQGRSKKGRVHPTRVDREYVPALALRVVGG